ncbi:MAG: rhomboid family intramembrane serine protease, partial [Mucispirillum sp.]|nr:rhomboid family intramembrane serine protease [Mucispirillum sp.]
MFPLKSSEPVKRYTIGIWLLIIINFGIYFYFYENRPPLLFTDYGFIPYKLSMPDNVIGIWEKAYSFFTYMFLHGNFLHVFVNMYFLYVFGRNAEDKLGTLPFLSVYILTGVIAVIPEAVMNPMM